MLHGDGPGSEINYRIAWARSYLKDMGLATNPDRGIWALTATGREITEEQIEPLRAKFVRKKRKQKKTRDEATEVDDIVDEDKWQDTLLDRLLDLDHRDDSLPPKLTTHTKRLYATRLGFRVRIGSAGRGAQETPLSKAIASSDW